MDFQVFGSILIVFLVSFLSYLFISKFLPHGKSFDDMIAEKKRMRDEVLGYSKPSTSKQTSAGNKKKAKKEVKKRDTPQKAAKEVTSNESDASEASEVVHSEPSTPPETLVLRKNVNKVQQSQSTSKKSKSKGGILVNKSEPVLVKEKPVEEAVNHFAEIHPKDDVEIHRSSVKESEKKQNRESKKVKPVKVETPPVSPKHQPIKEIKAVDEKPAKKKRSELSNTAAEGAVDVQLLSDGITPLIREIARADLTKNQMQVLIDFLLNKQSDTLAQDPTEWSEGKSDLVQKLKKQLQEKEAQLKNEQDQLGGIQSKLKELRSELNTEKMQFNANLKMHSEHLQNSRLEIKHLQSEIQFLTEKHNTEKQSMSVSFKQLQAQYLQMKETLKNQEGLPTIQQIQNDNQLLQQEIAKKSQQLKVLAEENRKIEEQLKNLSLESESKAGEFDSHLRKKDERCTVVENELRQRVQELSIEATRAKDFEKLVQRQSFELEQLKQNNHAEESSKIEIRNLQNALDSSKKELESQRILVADFKANLEDLNRQLAESKQLTNSKSSSDNFLLNEKMKELVANHENILGQKEKQLANYQTQVESLKKVESELTELIEEQKAKNNDLRTKNWKLIEALQTAQSSTAKTINHCNSVNHPTVDLAKARELFTKHFPGASPPSETDEDVIKWLDIELNNLKSHVFSNKTSSSNNVASPQNTNNVINNNHLITPSEVGKNNFNSDVNGGDSNSSTASGNEIVLLQNAQLKITVEEYKNIIAETESMLKNLESKVREQDAYWNKVCLMKDNEIEKLKGVTEKS